MGYYTIGGETPIFKKKIPKLNRRERNLFRKNRLCCICRIDYFNHFNISPEDRFICKKCSDYDALITQLLEEET